MPNDAVADLKYELAELQAMVPNTGLDDNDQRILADCFQDLEARFNELIAEAEGNCDEPTPNA